MKTRNTTKRWTAKKDDVYLTLADTKEETIELAKKERQVWEGGSIQVVSPEGVIHLSLLV